MARTLADSRMQLLDASVGQIEHVYEDCSTASRGPEGFSAQFQVCLPYRGMFVRHIGQDDVVGDANPVLFVTAGENYRISTPSSDGYAELIITPDQTVLSDVAESTGAALLAHPLFRARSSRITPRLQSLCARFLHWATDRTDVAELEAEELILCLLRSALQEPETRNEPIGPQTKRLIQRAKEFLEAELSNQVQLVDVGRAVGASPAYLTDTFRRSEGTSLHQYLTRLRLARALVQLPQADDLTALALDTGFSSHSHFSATFRRTFGLTPSQFRETARLRIYPLA